ncbi:hypothetical protein WV31_14165 [Magnetospirillum sp. ME-1]|uniref:hypothetical protein n=1 Tax=Magnetospirillum sp. ME-1 TaxID=1639348 RepID=UPI000A17A85C|nr:hypothetical protein [Magnetospirillum sp. ME-1]ARJ68169.1 hypothetical protein WV31_14165 [Magnetospirillum sp. ME-1]
MRRHLAASGEHDTLGDDILDELEGEALVILEHPDQHATITVNMARKTLEMIRRLRGRNAPGAAAPQVA